MRAVYPKFTVGRTSGPGPDGKRGFVLLVVVSVLAVGAVVGIAAYAGVRRWPETAVAAPHVRTETVVTRVHHRPGLARYLRSRADPAAATGLALTVAVALVVVGVAAVGVLLAMVRTNTGLARYDDWLARFGAEHATSASTTFLKDVSLLGGTAGIVLASLLVAVVEWRRVRSSALLGFLLLTVAGQFALSNAVKELVERARPDIDRLTGFAGTSFPSGHATAAAACYMACALLLGRQRPVRVKAALAGGAAAIAACVASTRVLLGVHWFTDVLAGALLGWGWFALCSIAFGGRLLRFGAPVEEAEEVAVAEAIAPSPH
jgi:membrane-associated phospholipid phosphatase